MSKINNIQNRRKKKLKIKINFRLEKRYARLQEIQRSEQDTQLSETPLKIIIWITLAFMINASIIMSFLHSFARG